MPHTITEMDNGSCKNMVSNLPLLFAGGYPTSLEKITEAQLEKFIPFMVQCSLGYIQIPTLDEYSEPEWWPADLEFMIPFSRPKSFSGNWLEKMRELVVICYSFHKCVFLLRFCSDLASYEPATLRFINNYNSTTSLYQRLTNKLLVTFRNENMLYDQAQLTSSRKCLLPKQANAQLSDAQHEQMVEPAFFDIYLCDDCDAELYSEDAYAEHERVCHNRKTVLEESDDDDVIFCGSEVLPAPTPPDESKSSEQSMSSFLMNFNLLSKNNPVPVRPAGSSNSSSLINNPNINILDGSPEKLRRLPRRTRGVVTLSKCTSIPLSSPCGQFLLKSIKTVMSPEYRRERLERLERFCFAPALVKDGTVVTNRPKWMNRSRINTNVAISFKRGSDEPDHYHSYKFPRRQFSTALRKQNFLFYNKLLLKRCKPCAVILERLTAQEIENRNIDIRLKNLNITRTSMAKGVQQDDGLRPVKHVVVDCIDLCSSDEEETTGAGVSYGSEDGCIITGDDPVVAESSEIASIRQLGADIANYKKSSELCSSATPFFRSDTDVSSFFGLANNKNAKHSTFQALTPSLHLFSSVQNTSQLGPSPAALISQPSSINNAAASSTGGATKESNAANDVFLSRVENLTEVKENRVNDWLNDTAITAENTATMPMSQSHMILSSVNSLASRALSPSSLVNATTPIVATNNNGIVAPKTLPSLMKLTKAPNSSTVDSVMRQRTVTAVDIK